MAWLHLLLPGSGPSGVALSAGLACKACLWHSRRAKISGKARITCDGWMRWGARAQQKPVCFDSLVPCHHASARADSIGQGKSECCIPTRIARRFLVYDPSSVRTNAMTTCPSCHSVHCAALDQDKWVEKRTRMCPHHHGMV